MLKIITVLYQGDCTFCRWCVGLVVRNSAPGVCVFHPLNSFEGRELIQIHKLQIDVAHPDTIVVLEEGKQPLYKWNAGVRIAKSTKFPFKLVYFFAVLIPRVIGDRMYDWVGRHRDLLCKMVRCKKET